MNIEYHHHLADGGIDNEFGRKLRSQWSNVGFLWLDGIDSEPMSLDLKQANWKIVKGQF
ncbi:MAG TPA: hypothetical protein VJX67_19510 [Blastocatellia bacterium]|nr:hypothetical protein [Blastocatellia bacterium]